MKFKQMKQIVAGIALSAVVIGATSFSAHPVLASSEPITGSERSTRVYRDVNDMTEQQRTDFKWFQYEKNKLKTAQWKADVLAGHMSEREMNARIMLQQERDVKELSGLKRDKKNTEDKESSKKFAKALKQADKAQKPQMLKEKLRQDYESGKISAKEYEALQVIMEERSKYTKDNKQLTAEQKAQRIEFNKKQKELTKEYIKKCVANGSLSNTQAEAMLKKLDQDSKTLKKPINRHTQRDS